MSIQAQPSHGLLSGTQSKKKRKHSKRKGSDDGRNHDQDDYAVYDYDNRSPAQDDSRANSSNSSVTASKSDLGAERQHEPAESDNEQNGQQSDEEPTVSVGAYYNGGMGGSPRKVDNDMDAR